MYKKTTMTVCAGACTVLLLLPMFSVVNACQVDDFYLTKEGSLAAVTPEALNDVLSTPNNQTKLNELVKTGTILKLKEGVKVQVMERSVEWKMLRITFPDGNATYWVKDGALSPIDCNK